MSVYPDSCGAPSLTFEEVLASCLAVDAQGNMTLRVIDRPDVGAYITCDNAGMPINYAGLLHLHTDGRFALRLSIVNVTGS